MLENISNKTLLAIGLAIAGIVLIRKTLLKPRGELDLYLHDEGVKQEIGIMANNGERDTADWSPVDIGTQPFTETRVGPSLGLASGIVGVSEQYFPNQIGTAREFLEDNKIFSEADLPGGFSLGSLFGIN